MLKTVEPLITQRAELKDAQQQNASVTPQNTAAVRQAIQATTEAARQPENRPADDKFAQLEQSPEAAQAAYADFLANADDTAGLDKVEGDLFTNPQPVAQTPPLSEADTAALMEADARHKAAVARGDIEETPTPAASDNEVEMAA
jgi:hypothetical protein